MLRTSIQWYISYTTIKTQKNLTDHTNEYKHTLLLKCAQQITELRKQRQ